jgi:hypothetical protein
MEPQDPTKPQSSSPVAPIPSTIDPSVRIADLEKALVRITQLETEVSRIGTTNAGLAESMAKKKDQIATLDGSLKQAVVSYQTLITRSNPDVLPEMLVGDTIAALDGSLAKARELIGKIKTGLETQSKAARIPAGAPLRAPADLTSLSPRDKIRFGMEHPKL